jgi:undecaprenyl-diphosphatase
MFYTCFFGFLLFLVFTLVKPSWKRTALMAIVGIPIPLIGVSRIYLGEHWASDAVGAYLLGGIALAGIIQFYRWGKSRFFVRQPIARSKR